MEVKTTYVSKFELPHKILKEFYCPVLPTDFLPDVIETEECEESIGEPSLITVDLNQVLDWLHSDLAPRPFESEVCDIPVLLFVPDFSTKHLLFHYDGTPQSANLIKNFIRLFGNLLHDSKATIISPSFIPKSKIKEEQEIIHLVSDSTHETSFIKFNFSRIGDFWSYAVKHGCTLLVTTKTNQADLGKVLYHFYKGEMWSDQLSFYLSL
ncbi:hypothetical protein [Algoriphagus sp. CAU 1675]|uniref:hypothetical protein n=1 Tax=Algoriphagus sp. CAU 1675 TaxID=3032597 RepID=UPI0023DAF5CC|nr:hypothetical protein [Algoriphagus sp. CAU 1675]MDF2158637.1 hypothetical protein [Algoriphagus sp. CAU 1675]